MLRRAGLVKQRREAGCVVYTLAVREVRDVLAAAGAALASLPGEGEAWPPTCGHLPPRPAGAVVGAVARAIPRRLTRRCTAG